MFDKILVANRGEIAVRIMQACRELGIRTVAVYSQADADALHVHLADEAVCIGPPANRDSYLNVANIVSAAVVTGADAIHPGYGNLAEVASFAEVCETCKITFIGPPPEVIAKMGNKAEARRMMKEAGVPVIPGSEDGINGPRDVRRLAREIGYPLMLKAALGGGGRGIRVVHNDEQIPEALDLARAEAKAAFGSDEIYVEHVLSEPRHIEVQILADAHGNIIHLGERECSIQFRRQKLLEEAPSPAVDRALRKKLGETAIRAARAVGYQNAGTVEFLLDEKGRFHFMEMNTRVQVEHGVSEMLTGVDIVREQIRIAAGERLQHTQGRIWFEGHAIECRILAADPERDFRPSPGRITRFWMPNGPGIRVDRGVTTGSVVPLYYDPMIAKVICWDVNRAAAIERMKAALRGMVVEGVKTNITHQLNILGNHYFGQGMTDLRFLERRM